MKYCIQQLGDLYKNEKALHEKQFHPDGFVWEDLNHRSESVIAYRRKGEKPEDDVVVVLNMTPMVRKEWKLKLKGKKAWKEIFNSDMKEYWGTGDVFNPKIKVALTEDNVYEVTIHLPALAAVVLK
jgi:1,4-alpha-glucan branching enzyme